MTGDGSVVIARRVNLFFKPSNDDCVLLTYIKLVPPSDSIGQAGPK